jgi:NitT/TauT family transport system ATP-binding protein
MPDIVLKVDGVSHWFGSNRVLYDVSFEVACGQIVSLVGPSGCGKSTLLRAILGTHPPCAGSIYMNGMLVDQPGRDRGIVYQRYSLFPFLTAVQNVAFGLMLDQTTLTQRSLKYLPWRKLRRRHLEQAAGLLKKLGLGAAIGLYPTEMSGGMCQRVAIAQALIMKPQILLLDEPFGALDEATREELQHMLLELYQENLSAKAAGTRPPHTIVIVTHELNEAIYVADRVLGLSQYWQWEATGQATAPGASIIYDKTAPVFHPTDAREYQQFLEQRREIRRVVFDHDHRQPRKDHLVFWRQCERGEAAGILAR